MYINCYRLAAHADNSELSFALYNLLSALPQSMLYSVMNGQSLSLVLERTLIRAR